MMEVAKVRIERDAEPVIMKVCRRLVQQRYVLGWNTGYAGRILPSDREIGILSTRDAKPWYRYLFGRRAFLGILRVSEPNEWVFEVTGRRYLDSAVAIAQVLESEFHVSILVKCIQEEPAVETGTFLDSLAYPL